MVSEAAAPLTVRFHGAGEVPTYRNRAVHVWPGSPVAVRRRSGAPWAAPARQNRARGAVRGACGSAVPAPHGPLCPCRPTRLCGRCFSASTLCRGSAWRRTGCSRSEYRHGTPRGWIPPSLLYASVRNEPRGTGRGGQRESKKSPPVGAPGTALRGIALSVLAAVTVLWCLSSAFTPQRSPRISEQCSALRLSALPAVGARGHGGLQRHLPRGAAAPGPPAG